MKQQKSYEEQFIERIDREFEEFKKKLENECKTQGDLMARSYEIWLKSSFASTLTEMEGVTEATYKKWCETEGNILHGLYESYRDDKGVFSNEEGDKSRIVGEYFKGIIAEEDYKKLAIEKIERQFEDFKVQLLAECQTKEDMFYKAFEINIKTALRNAMSGEEMPECIYYAIFQTEENALANMYTDFIGEKASVNTQRESAAFIENYCERYYSDLIEEYEQSLFDIQQS